MNGGLWTILDVCFTDVDRQSDRDNVVVVDLESVS
jgi:hypothetical protein